MRPPAATRVCFGGGRVQGGGPCIAPAPCLPACAARRWVSMLAPCPSHIPFPLPPAACYLLNQPAPSFLRLPPHARGSRARARPEPTRSLTLDMAVRAGSVTVHKASMGQDLDGADELFDGGGSGLTETTASAPGTATAGVSARAAWAPQQQPGVGLARQRSSGAALGPEPADEESSTLLDVSGGCWERAQSGGMVARRRRIVAAAATRLGALLPLAHQPPSSPPCRTSPLQYLLSSARLRTCWSALRRRARSGRLSSRPGW